MFHTEQQDATSVPIWPVEYLTVVEHIPGSNDDVVHHLGRKGVQEVTIAIVVPGANWAAFSALQGQTAALNLIGNSSRQATLTKLANARWFQREAVYKAQATFLG